MPENFKNYSKTTFLIGMGFFTMGLMDPIYDSYVPIFLGDYISSKGLVGFIMTLDNIFALFLIPLVSALSDRTRTPLGRRMPWILATLPPAAVFFALIPFAGLRSLVLLVGTVFLLNIFKQAARGPVVALMPDTIPEELRSEANGVINTMGGIAAIVGTIGLSKLMDVSVVLPLVGDTARKLPFMISGLLVITAALLLFMFVKEKISAQGTSGEGRTAAQTDEAAPADGGQTEKRPGIMASLAQVFRSPRNAAGDGRGALFLLLALFFWFFGYQGILPFLTMYTRDILGVSEGTAGLSPGMFAAAYAIFAIPSGVLAHRIGRAKTIRAALCVMTLICVLLFLHEPITRLAGLSPIAALVSFWALLFCMGMFWVAVITNSFPMLWGMASYENIGVYTGLYYTFSQAAAILSPPVTGLLIDTCGFPALYAFGAVCMLTAFVFMKKVKPDKGHRLAFLTVFSC
ncbi:MAG: MFS transporter [Spirochaetales bacterium]|jgi:MFS family permease|nr:MFS transporter [Spirochaetales bacterium]